MESFEKAKKPGLIRLVVATTSIILVWGVVSYYFIGITVQLFWLAVIFVAYFSLAYLFLPRIIYILVLIFRQSRIPRYTHAPDGILADPINIILFGSEDALKSAFHEAGWSQADPITIATTWRMFRAFFWSKSYPEAPFSPLFLFGRKQDFGFQKNIGDSPRMRHHVRFWAANIEREIDLESPLYWIRKKKVDPEKPLMWVGAASKDIGFGFARFTYQLTHSVDEAVDKEREFIIDSLLSKRKITDIKMFATDALVKGRYISDSRIITAYLKS
jgi:LssY C-terminus